MKSWWVMCAWCKKKVRQNNEQTWRDINSIDPEQLERTNLSHGICPTCEESLTQTFKNPTSGESC